MTGTETQSIERNIDAASRFLTRVQGLAPTAREQIGQDAFGSSSHTSAMMMVADEVSSLKNKDREGRLGSFLVDLEQRVDGMGLQPEIADLVKAAARGLLVQSSPGLERAARQLYSPFERVVPLESASQ
jgi:hypothetical protein